MAVHLDMFQLHKPFIMSDGDSDMEIKGYEDEGLSPEQANHNQLLPNVDIFNGGDGHGSRHINRNHSPPTDGQSYLAMHEQPQQRGFRFRYQCEGTSHGGIQGERSSRHNKTYPSVKINNYHGKARVTAILVTNEENPRMHAHEIIGKSCVDGICTVDSSGTNPIFTFPQLGIHHVKKKNVANVLQERILKQQQQSYQIMHGHPLQISKGDKDAALSEAQQTSKSMQLDVVCLQFTAFLLDEKGQFSKRLAPVTTKPVYNSKSPGAGALKICRMDKHAGCCSGGDEVFLLCDKVQKDDISVRFFELDVLSQEPKWEAYGNFGPADVHRQYAIVFRTPEYHNKSIKDPIQVQVQLKRPTDGELSEPKPFTYYPREVDKEEVGRKRKKPILSFNSNFFQGNQFSGFNIPSGLGGSGGVNQGSMSYGGSQSNGGGSSQMSDHSDQGTNHSNDGSQQQLFYPPPPPYSVPSESFTNQQTMPAMMSQQPFYQFPAMYQQQPMGQTGNQQQFMNGGGAMQGQGQNYQGQFVPMGGDVGFPNFINQMNMMNQMNAGGGGGYNILDDLDDLQQDGGDSGTDSDASSERLEIDLQPKIEDDDDLATDGETTKTTFVKVATLKPRLGSDVVSDGGDSDADADDEAQSDLDQVDGHIKEQKPALDELDGALFHCHPKQFSPLTELSLDKLKLADPDLDTDEPTVAGPQTTDHLLSMKHDFVLTKHKPDSISGLLYGQESKVAHLHGLQRDLQTFNLVSQSATSRQTQTSPVPQDTPPVPQPSQPIRAPPAPRLNGTGDIFSQLMERSIQGLRDFAQTGDVAYLLFVQRHLLAAQDDNGDSSIHLAVINEQLYALYALLRVVASLNSTLPVNDYNNLRQTPLHLAVILNQPQMVAMLILYGADPSLVDAQGNTPTHLACIKGYDECLQVLVNRPKKPELNKRNFEGLTPLQLAVLSGSLYCVRTLLRAGVNVNQTDGKSGRTALHHAVEANNSPITGALILQGRADVNARTFDDNTPLHLACGWGFLEMARILIAAGADPHAENSDLPDDLETSSCDSDDSMSMDEVTGVTPFDLAANNQKLIEILEGRGRPQSNSFSVPSVMRCSPVQSSQDVPDRSPKSLPADIHSQKETRTCVKLKLDSGVQERLCQVLDHEERWVDVARKFQLDYLVTVFRQRPSPTSALLHNLEAMEKSSKQLEKALSDLKMTDAVKILTDAVKISTPPKYSSLTEGHDHDSGIGSLKLQQ